MSVFISYSSKDREFVDKLSSELVKNRIPVWLDRWEMQVGDSLLDKIQEGLTDSSFLLVVLSENSINSPWCKKELNSGLMTELNKKKVFIIPIKIDDCEVPLFLQEKLYADFRIDFDHGFKELMRPLKKLFSEHMGRVEKDDVVTDYAINWGINETSNFYTSIDIINWYHKDRKSILLQINIIGCENATERFRMQVSQGLSWLMKESVISMMVTNEDFRKLNILAQNDDVFLYNITTKDIISDITFDIKLRAVLMGVDNNNDVVLNLVDFLEMLDKSRDERI